MNKIFSFPLTAVQAIFYTSKAVVTSTPSNILSAFQTMHVLFTRPIYKKMYKIYRVVSYNYHKDTPPELPKIQKVFQEKDQEIKSEKNEEKVEEKKIDVPEEPLPIPSLRNSIVIDPPKNVEENLETRLAHYGAAEEPSFPKNPKDFLKKLECNDIRSYGMWIGFSKGNPIPEGNPEHQWKLFLNPRVENFSVVLERAIKALSSMDHVHGKIVDSATRRRISGKNVVDDPAEPKIVFYFRGDSDESARKRFQEAMLLLEKEFTEDANLLACPQGQRKRSNGDVVSQWGPSMTRLRDNQNYLMFYTQGGYTESYRDVHLKELDEYFHPKGSYYLHRNPKTKEPYPDPLDDTIGHTLVAPIKQIFDEIEDVISGLEFDSSLLNVTKHLTELKNLHNRLEKLPDPEQRAKELQERCKILIEKQIEKHQAPSILQSLIFQALEREIRLLELTNKKSFSKDDWARCKKIQEAKISHKREIQKDILKKNADNTREMSLENEIIFSIVENFAERCLKDLRPLLSIIGKYSNDKIDLNSITTLFDLAKALNCTHEEAFKRLNTWIFKAEDAGESDELAKFNENLLNECITAEFAREPLLANRSFPEVVRTYEEQLRIDQNLAQLGKKFEPNLLPDFSSESSQNKLIADVAKLFRDLDNHPSILVKPYHVVKLNNIGQALKSLPHEKAKDLKEKCGALLEITLKQLTQNRKKLVDMWIANSQTMPHIKNAMNALYVSFSQPKKPELNLFNQSEKTKIEFVLEQAVELREFFQHILDNRNQTISVNTVLDRVPERFRNLFIQIVGNTVNPKDNLSFREYLMDALIRESKIFKGRDRNSIAKSLETYTIVWRNQNVCFLKKSSVFDSFKFKIEDVPPEYLYKALETLVKKLENIENRLKIRNQNLQNNNANFLPYYFHATNSSTAALSIAGTAIESSNASLGYGTFLAPEPLLRYGFVAFGLPKSTGMSSAVTVTDDLSSHIPDIKGTWIALRNSILINPNFKDKELELRLDLERALEKASITLLESTPDEAKAEVKAFLEEIKQLSLRTFTPRANPSGINKEIQLNYRKFNYKSLPDSNVISLQSLKDVKDWFEFIIRESTYCMDPYESYIRNKREQTFIDSFTDAFKDVFKIENDRVPEFSIDSTSEIKAVIIAPDDDPEIKDSLYSLYLNALQSRAAPVAKDDFCSLSSLKEKFEKVGFSNVEYVPFSEQLIETDLVQSMGESAPPVTIALGDKD